MANEVKTGSKTQGADAEAFDFWKVPLSQGAHGGMDGQYCVMEAFAAHLGEKITDDPDNISRVLRAISIAINDRFAATMTSDQVLRFKGLVLRTENTGSNLELDIKRAFMCADFAIRFAAPQALRAAGLPEEAAKLEALTPVTDSGSASSARLARSATEAAWLATWLATAATEAAIIDVLLDLLESLLTARLLDTVSTQEEVD